MSGHLASVCLGRRPRRATPCSLRVWALLLPVASCRKKSLTKLSPVEPEKAHWVQHDWYFGWNGSEADGGGVRGILDRAGVRPAHRLLHVGCGTSEVTESLWRSGFSDVTHLDLSADLIQQLSARLSFTNHTFAVGDLTGLTFADGVFDVVLDKGALDAVSCKDPTLVRAAARHVARVLRPRSGLYIMVSRFDPAQWLPSLSRHGEEGEPPAFGECSMQVHPLSPFNQIGARYSYTCREPARLPQPQGEL
mmetsp:Transcript_122919/g.342523  ORF Transcript_122919/g.342523 Transcript_122919/m.342523 type:complete len:250 (-) Transcript_122919:114-863(-)